MVFAVFSGALLGGALLGGALLGGAIVGGAIVGGAIVGVAGDHHTGGLASANLLSLFSTSLSVTPCVGKSNDFATNLVTPIMLKPLLTVFPTLLFRLFLVVGGALLATAEGGAAFSTSEGVATFATVEGGATSATFASFVGV